MSTSRRSFHPSFFVGAWLLTWPARAAEPVSPTPAPTADAAAEPSAQAAEPSPAQQPPQPAATTEVGIAAAEPSPAPAPPKPQTSVVLGSAEKGASSQGGVDVGTGGWHMSYHGFFRAPMRVGIGTRTNAQRVPAVSATNPNGVIPPQSITTAGGQAPPTSGVPSITARPRCTRRSFPMTST